jgi:hypothetical protein
MRFSAPCNNCWRQDLWRLFVRRWGIVGRALASPGSSSGRRAQDGLVSDRRLAHPSGADRCPASHLRVSGLQTSPNGRAVTRSKVRSQVYLRAHASRPLPSVPSSSFTPGTTRFAQRPPARPGLGRLAGLSPRDSPPCKCVSPRGGPRVRLRSVYRSSCSLYAAEWQGTCV